ncbi:aspartyl-phosphate phosphatase Spo0E family protein [Brevibacillus borstelensis]|uniref:aspartyl-phosphate phosphatase Spo0E family protein n=1 Tax=Brevibacillus borstelensis TaxID=45462 RepID=UPI002E1FA62A|nr:aspartyl-phosphate phosphatase Spo0E family protein [Brevibacillus borstelensis]
MYQTIEDLRRELVRLVQEKGSFTDEVVVELSQRLDGYIYAIQSGRYIRSNITTEEG